MKSLKYRWFSNFTIFWTSTWFSRVFSCLQRELIKVERVQLQFLKSKSSGILSCSFCGNVSFCEKKWSICPLNKNLWGSSFYDNVLTLSKSDELSNQHCYFSQVFSCLQALSNAIYALLVDTLKHSKSR